MTSGNPALPSRRLVLGAALGGGLGVLAQQLFPPGAPVESTTTLSPPAGAYSAATGSIGVKVQDAAGVPQDNTAVSISIG